MLNELVNSGVKYRPDDVLAVTQKVDDKLVWLEDVNLKTALEYIMRHADDSAAKGISKNQIQNLFMKALNKGGIVGYQGKGKVDLYMKLFLMDGSRELQ